MTTGPENNVFECTLLSLSPLPVCVTFPIFPEYKVMSYLKSDVTWETSRLIGLIKAVEVG